MQKMYLCLLILLVGLPLSGSDFVEKKMGFPSKKFEADVMAFFKASNEMDYAKVYSFAHSEYSSRLPFELFKKTIKGWKLVKVEVLTTSWSTDISYVILGITEHRDNGILETYEIMFWKETESGFKFMNFPFSFSRLPNFYKYHSFGF